jgi:hypothetical protein
VTEAGAHGVPAVACGGEATDVYGAEIAGGLLLVAGTTPEIVSGLTRMLRGERQPVAVERPRALDAMRRLLDGEIATHPIIERLH